MTRAWRCSRHATSSWPARPAQLNELALGLTERIFMQMMFGELAAAESLTQELQTVTQQLQTESEAVGSGLYDVAFVRQGAAGGIPRRSQRANSS